MSMARYGHNNRTVILSRGSASGGLVYNRNVSVSSTASVSGADNDRQKTIFSLRSFTSVRLAHIT